MELHPGGGRLPDWLVIGTPKSGTTALATWLAAHPDAYLAPEKEVSFFNEHFERGLDWYRSRFAAAGPDQRVGEASPLYLYDARALRRMAAAVPGAALVVLVREPVSRAWSNFHFLRSMGVERRSFAEAIAAERAGGPRPAWLRTGYLDMGRYARYLAALPGYGLPAPCVIFTDELRASPARTFADVCRHLGIADDVLPYGEDPNPTGRPRSLTLARLLVQRPWPKRWQPWVFRAWRWNLRPGIPPLDRGLAAELRAEFAEDNAALAALVGRDLPPGW
ncbi:MAG: sulfotransferase domain-containing protein [Mycobacteriales bacterium]